MIKSVFTHRQQKRMEEVQNDHMPDGCRIHSLVSEEQDELGQPIPKYEIGPIQECGFTMHLSMERFVNSGEGQKFFYTIRLPRGTAIKKTDLVEMVHRGGVNVEKQIIFEVSGEPRYGITATLVGLKEHVP